MTKAAVNLAVIGGTGLTNIEGLTITRREMIKTPFGTPSGPVIFGEIEGKSLAFLARHGNRHSIPPHRIPYCANIWALHSVGIKSVIAVGAVGGIADDCTTGSLVIPDQIIDYTYDRGNTFFDGKPNEVKHIDFSYPYSESLRQTLIKACSDTAAKTIDQGVYGVTQGPRLETAAEISRMQRDGCTVVGMTAMPETSLARELELDYASCAVVVNRAAGKQLTGERAVIDADELSQGIATGMKTAREAIVKALNAHA